MAQSIPPAPPPSGAREASGGDVPARELGPQVVRVIDAAARWCTAYDRPDLAARLASVIRRLDQRTTTVCVAGEYKQGKSALVDALVGRAICPVDDDDATVTFSLIGSGQAALRVHRLGSDAPAVADEPVDRIGTYALERGNPGNREGIRLLEIRVPSPLLARGIALVDSPGLGGLRSGPAAAVLAFLRQADALLFVTDALTELSGPELDFLARAQDVCPEVIVALSKIDLAPFWRRIADLDRGHLERRGIRASVVPVSAVLRDEAVRRHDPDLDGESGVPALVSTLERLVLDLADASALAWGLAVLEDTIGKLAAQLQAERAVLEDPAAGGRLLQELAEAQRRQADLRSAGTRWTVVLGDGIADLTQVADAGARELAQSIVEWADAELGRVDPAAGWDAFSQTLQQRVGEGSARLIDAIQVGAAELATRLGRLIDEEGRPPVEILPYGEVDVEAVWAASPRVITVTRAGPVPLVVNALRSGVGGIYLLGTLGGIAGLAVASPISVGVATVVGIKHVLDERGRERERREREARDVVRRFVADVQAELAGRSRRALQDTQRTLRDGLAAQIEQLATTTAARARSLQQALEAEAGARDRRTRHLGAELERLGQLRAAGAALGRRLGLTVSTEAAGT